MACGWGKGQGQPRSDASGGDVGAREDSEAVKVQVSTTNKEVEVVDVGDAAPKGRIMRATRVRTRT